MLALKLVGAALLISSSALTGNALYSYECAKLKESEAFLNLIRHIKTRISCYRTPIPEIISDYESKELKECGFLDGFDISWNDALSSCTEKLHIDDETKKLLTGFGDELGASAKDEQMNACDYYIERLGSHVEDMRTRLPQKQKLYRSCPILLGALAVIIFL